MSALTKVQKLATFILCSVYILGTADAAEQVSAVNSDVALIDSKFFLFSDTQVAYYHIVDSREPGVTGGRVGDAIRGRSIPKQVLNISHADAWAYGTNFFSLDILKSGSQDPAGVLAPRPVLYDYGATEAYGVYRGTLDINKIYSKIKCWSWAVLSRLSHLATALISERRTINLVPKLVSFSREQ